MYEANAGSQVVVPADRPTTVMPSVNNLAAHGERGIGELSHALADLGPRLGVELGAELCQPESHAALDGAGGRVSWRAISWWVRPS